MTEAEIIADLRASLADAEEAIRRATLRGLRYRKALEVIVSHKGPDDAAALVAEEALTTPLSLEVS